MSFPDMIYDRDQTDLTNDTIKAYHNIADLRRINDACSFLAGVFSRAGFTPTLNIKPEWGAFDYTEENIGRLLSNVQQLRSLVDLPQTTPEVPSIESFGRPTIEKANDIEKILYDVYVRASELGYV